MSVVTKFTCCVPTSFILRMGRASFPPAEARLDALADPLTEEVTLIPSRACIDRPVALLGDVHRHVNSHSVLAALGDEVGGVVDLIRR